MKLASIRGLVCINAVLSVDSAVCKKSFVLLVLSSKQTSSIQTFACDYLYVPIKFIIIIIISKIK